ncbi:kinase-like domain-containing protein [Boletus edulis]|uniref:Kinase-like domain-containing protein n=1 Tax=Boletus edulis BED1 TaxID=1328754 RepID=A0AAD4G990_BOLED|nr:kinase-like domain-containing protein [Boletus edulis]KAF8122336.1 kinase-like domain-containing protein [Boletus edulis]KAF8123650.1 kinase-like domain-containing protein [Boletus edulis]KAF8125364.1 kinase-like domain-containing protein [Boletus edulis]KAF8431642.1 kinase-like domain-containing protein [Boletus edulis BED1]
MLSSSCHNIATASGYLHNMKPIVVHGDLKVFTNILISDEGHALISDFGLSTVVEELSLTNATLRAAQLGTSLLAESTRWMAPELIHSLIEDIDGAPCPVTRESDVFSFACVCLEVRVCVYAFLVLTAGLASLRADQT